jgi:hypothetical protein
VLLDVIYVFLYHAHVSCSNECDAGKRSWFAAEYM